MGSRYFKEFLEKEKWLDISPIAHIQKRHLQGGDEYIWNRARSGQVVCATRFTVSARVMVEAIRLCVKAKADELEEYCYGNYAGEAPYASFSIPLYTRHDGKRGKMVLGGGYRRREALAGKREFVETNILRIVVARSVDKNRHPQFKVINAYPDIGG